VVNDVIMNHLHDSVQRDSCRQGLALVGNTAIENQAICRCAPDASRSLMVYLMVNLFEALLPRRWNTSGLCAMSVLTPNQQAQWIRVHRPSQTETVFKALFFWSFLREAWHTLTLRV
jgi:hypothetical protein